MSHSKKTINTVNVVVAEQFELLVEDIKSQLTPEDRLWFFDFHTIMQAKERDNVLNSLIKAINHRIKKLRGG